MRGLFFVVDEGVVAFFFLTAEGFVEFGDFFEVLGEEGDFDFAEGDVEGAHLLAVFGEGLGLGFSVGHFFEHGRGEGDGLEDGVLGFASEFGALGGILFAAEGLEGIVDDLHLFGEGGIVGADGGGEASQREGEGGDEKFLHTPAIQAVGGDPVNDLSEGGRMIWSLASRGEGWSCWRGDGGTDFDTDDGAVSGDSADFAGGCAVDVPSRGFL